MSDVAEVCIINIGPRERRKRMRFGVISLIVGLGILGAMVATGADVRLRLLLFLPFAAAGSGFFQARDKT